MRHVLALVAVGALTTATVAPAIAGDVTCGAVRNLRSLNSDTPARMTFVNTSGATRFVYWIDFQGNTQQYAMLQPGQRFSVNTFLTHPWEITDGPGDCIEVFLPRAGSRSVNLRADHRRRRR